MPHSDHMRPLAQAFDRLWRESGLSQRRFAAQFGASQQRLNNWIADKGQPELEELPDIEKALGLRKGTILRMAGLVDDPRTTREAIEADTTLAPHGKEATLDAYDGAIARSGVKATTSPAMRRRSSR